VGIRCADQAKPSICKKLALTSPTSGGRSVGIVRLWTKATEFTSYAVLFRDISTIIVFENFAAFFPENRHFMFWVIFEGPIFLELKCP
jgi:hypothetical protein